MKLKVNPIGPNKTEIQINPSTQNELIIFYSYEKPVVCIWHNVVYRTEKFWSTTTSRHIHEYLGEDDDSLRVPQSFFEEVIDKCIEKGV